LIANCIKIAFQLTFQDSYILLATTECIMVQLYNSIKSEYSRYTRISITVHKETKKAYIKKKTNIKDRSNKQTIKQVFVLKIDLCHWVYNNAPNGYVY